MAEEKREERCRKLMYRSHRRGMQEMDLLLGAFADSFVLHLTEDELDGYERLLDMADDQLFLFLSGACSIVNIRDKDIRTIIQQVMNSLSSLKFQPQ